MALHEGDQIAERYRLSRRIAVGGMGEVWESKDLRLNRTVAIKVLKPEIGSDPDFLARFRTEAQIAASLNHRGIAGVHDYGEGVTPDGTPTAYLVMELVHGEPLSTRLSSRGKLGPVLTLDLLEQTGRGLYAAHSRGFVHRDVKPGNILLSNEGTVKLTDFGIAKAASAAPVTESGMVMGTAHYIAPEQAKGEDASPASDVYSLAVVGYECLVGQRPFLATSPVEVAMMHIHDPVPPLPDDVPENVRKLIEIGLAKDPNQRYRDGGEFAAAVGMVRRGQPPPDPGTVVVQSTSGALPAVGTLPQDRQALETPAPDPVADGIALTGLASPSLPPLPGNQRTGGTARTGSTSRTSGTGTGTGGTPTATGTGPRGALGTGPRSALGTGPTGTDPQAAVAGQRRFTPPSPTKGGRAALMATFVALTLAAVAIGFYVVRSAVHTESVPPPVPGRAAPSAVVPGPAGPGPAGSGPAGSPGSAPGGTSALIDPQGFTGRAADAALGELRNAGLVPSVVTTTGGPPPRPAACVVTGLQPAGTLARGTAVTVTCIQR